VPEPKAHQIDIRTRLSDIATWFLGSMKPENVTAFNAAPIVTVNPL
jgi:hypothetical protein